jgi:hypothetical protein
MTYLSRRHREIREEDGVPSSARQAARARVSVRFMGKDIDPITAWRIGSWPVQEIVNYRGRGA